MTEHEIGAHASARPPLTGHTDIDRVLDLISGLDQRPVEEHAAVYAASHDEMRRALEPSQG